MKVLRKSLIIATMLLGRSAITPAAQPTQPFYWQDNLNKEAILKYGVNTVDSDGDTPLMEAVMAYEWNKNEGKFVDNTKNKLEIAAFLIQNGADVNFKRARDGWTPLIRAISQPFADFDNKAMVQLLIQNKADVNAKANDEYKMTPLAMAINYARLDIVKLLIPNGADIKKDINTKYGNHTFLLMAVDKQNPALVQLLLDNGADVNVKDDNDRTPLAIAIYNRDLDMIKLLVNNKADVNSKDKWGKNALMSAAETDNLEAVKLFIQNTTDINAQDNEGKTALMRAIAPNNLEIVTLLVNNKANVNAKDLKGNTPLSIAKKIAENWSNTNPQAEKIINYLKENGAKE